MFSASARRISHIVRGVNGNATSASSTAEKYVGVRTLQVAAGQDPEEVGGEAISMKPNGEINVPDKPVICFIEGDGTGPDIWRASQRVADAAVAKAYGGKKQIVWKEVLAGEKAFKLTNDWLPQDTIDSYKKIPCRDQRTANHSYRRRVPKFERRSQTRT